jgi:hypothetical protein
MLSEIPSLVQRDRAGLSCLQSRTIKEGRHLAAHARAEGNDGGKMPPLLDRGTTLFENPSTLSKTVNFVSRGFRLKAELQYFFLRKHGSLPPFQPAPCTA